MAANLFSLHIFVPILGLIALHVAMFAELLPVELDVLVSSALIIYAGSHIPLAQSAVLDAEEDQQEAVAMSARDAMMMPLQLGGVLAALYVGVRYIDPSWTGFLVSVYFSIVASLSIGGLIGGFLQQALYGQRPDKVLFTVPWLNVPITLTGVAGGILGIALVSAERLVDSPEASWVLNNAVAVLVCLSSIGLLNLGSPSTGAMLLAGLFIYDVLMVFGTGMMQEVATSLDVPIKLLYPIPGAGGPKNMLGLGDIVLPGAFLALLLRFDALRAGHWLPRSMALAAFQDGEDPTTPSASGSLKDDTAPASASGASSPAARSRASSGGQALLLKPGTPGGSARQLSFFKPHFGLGLSYYVAGMSVTLVVMQLFRHAQPALLYLVPALLVALVTSAIVMGDIEALLRYTEEVEEEEGGTEEAGGEVEQEGADSDSGEQEVTVVGADESTDNGEQADDEPSGKGARRRRTSRRGARQE